MTGAKDGTEGFELAPAFPNAYAEITRPDEVIFVSRYFYRRWARRLGPVATSLLIALRRRCYLNRESGEERDICHPRVNDLAEEIGVHRTTAMRGLATLEDLGFLTRAKRFKANAIGMTSRLPDRCRVLLVDPIAPEDKNRAESMQLEIGGPISREMRPINEQTSYEPADPVTSMISDRSQNATERSVAKCDRIRPFLESNGNNVQTLGTNVDKSRSGKNLGPRVELLVQDAEQIIGDRKSRGFLILCAARMPEDVMRAAMSETKAAAADGRIRGARGSYFVGIMKRQAEDLGISLKGRG